MVSIGPARPVPRLHVVTDDTVLTRPGFRECAAAVLAAGGAALALHIRGPATSGGPLVEEARALLAPARAAGTWLVINDRVDVALAVGADGAHLGVRSLPVSVARRLLGSPGRVGASVHSMAEAETAVTEGAEWIFAGTVYGTPSHPGQKPAGPAFLGDVARVAGGVPVLAIGGVTPGRVAEVLAAGAWGVAVIRGVWDAPDPIEAVRRYLEELAAPREEP
jgi:thiamine-phosphate diphosphorylase